MKKLFILYNNSKLKLKMAVIFGFGSICNAYIAPIPADLQMVLLKHSGLWYYYTKI